MGNDNNPFSKAGDEFFRHIEREDGSVDLYYGSESAEEHGHAVIGPDGNPRYIREPDGRIIADDKK